MVVEAILHAFDLRIVYRGAAVRQPAMRIYGEETVATAHYEKVGGLGYYSRLVIFLFRGEARHYRRLKERVTFAPVRHETVWGLVYYRYCWHDILCCGVNGIKLLVGRNR